MAPAAGSELQVRVALRRLDLAVRPDDRTGSALSGDARIRRNEALYRGKNHVFLNKNRYV